MPRLQPSGRTIKRLDSDADALPFPEGGVFGRARGERHVIDSRRVPAPPFGDSIRDAEMTIERIGRQFDSLKTQVEEVIFHLPRDPGWRPHAA